MLVGVALLACALGLVSASAKANFSGTWTLDKAHSEGLPPELKAQTLTVVQTDDKLSIEASTTRESGEVKQSETYVLDGKQTDYKPQAVMGYEGTGKRTARWGADGNSVEVKEVATYDTPMGAVDVNITRKWTLSADGKSLTIDMTIESPQGTRQMKRVFTRSK